MTCEAMSAGFKTEAGADFLFRFGSDVAEGAHGAGDLADAQVLGGGVEAGEVARQFIEP